MSSKPLVGTMAYVDMIEGMGTRSIATSYPLIGVLAHFTPICKKPHDSEGALKGRAVYRGSS